MVLGDDEVIADLDLPTVLNGDGLQIVKMNLQVVRSIYKAQYLVSSSVYELEPQVFDNLKAKFASPIYPFGPSIPYFELSKISKAQMDEIVAGVQNSGARFLWVARGDASKLKDGVGHKGLVVSWCDQLRVLCHDSIGGFWSHCGWNSTLEAVYAVFQFSLALVLKKKKKGFDEEDLVTREEIVQLVQRFMDLESKEGKEMRERAKQLRETCQGAIAKGGSSDTNLDAFIKDVFHKTIKIYRKKRENGSENESGDRIEREDERGECNQSENKN
ncbi:hypothetical protein Prudu_015774 [Prunus dulcis]|uniref:UDP-Glycosyltransferase superfamily protein n=1 Tax=Prunus dulcis TaxID=3755 RepID=A0A4Y1RJS1_PRUDU|nr:hypothetical protein Prudu_015774 [Prunus dulcis]